ncbi:MAG: CBS domain-containing protein [Calditrichaeota bacterium]|nr:MAG: CBS domain-containing protein [Calditrichota bacterium]
MCAMKFPYSGFCASTCPGKNLSNSSLTVNKNSTILQMVELLVSHPNARFIAVVDDAGKLLGLIRCKRLFQAVFSQHNPPDLMLHQLFTFLTSETSGELMLTHILTAKEEDLLEDIIKTMLENDISSMPIVDEQSHFLGLITLPQLLEPWLEKQKQDAGNSSD